MTIALDSNIFIYVLEAHPLHYEAAYKLLEHIENNGVRGVASTLCFTEVLAKPKPVDPSVNQNAQLLLEGLEHIDYLPVDLEVSIRAGQLRAQYGPALRAPDAIHLATALYAQADVFITNDKKLAALRLDGLTIELLGLR